MEINFKENSLIQLASSVNNKELSAVMLVQKSLDVIEELNPAINAFCAVNPESSMVQAEKVDALIKQGSELPLAGIPIGVKDLEDAKGFTTTFGSNLHLNDNPATNDSILVSRLKKLGAVVVGKTNTPEFGYKGITDNIPFGATKNPWNEKYSPGGSSGGSAAAIASGMVPLATGSDGGGSIRIPAALCGLSGIKLSQGRIPNGGIKPPGSGLLTVKGPMTKTIHDTAYVLDECMGPDPTDIFSLQKPSVRWLPQLDCKLPEQVVWSSTMGFNTLDDEVAEWCEVILEKLKDAGVKIIREEEIWTENPIFHWIVFWTSARAKAQGHLRGTEKWDQIDQNLRKQIEMGMDKFTALDYAKAVDQCHTLNFRLNEIFKKAPLILTPVIRGLTPKLYAEGTVNGAETTDWVGFTPPINMTRNPAGTVPAGTSKYKLPMGVQIIGPQMADLEVLKAIAALENIF